MSKITTIFVDLKKLARLEDAPVVVRLMMVCNDVLMANAKLGEYYPPGQDADDRDRGPILYFHRVETSHLCEAMAIIKDLRDRPPMVSLLKQCSSHAQSCFEKLAACLTGGTDCAYFNKHVTTLRSNVGFHYNESEKLIRRALHDRANTSKKLSSISTSNDARKTRYDLADDILNTLIVHQIWDAKGEEMNDKLSEVLGFLDRLTIALLGFAGKFITRYIRQNASF